MSKLMYINCYSNILFMPSMITLEMVQNRAALSNIFIALGRVLWFLMGTGDGSAFCSGFTFASLKVLLRIFLQPSNISSPAYIRLPYINVFGLKKIFFVFYLTRFFLN